MTRIGVVSLPGSLGDRVAARAVRLAGATAVPLWHAANDLGGVDAVLLAGRGPHGNVPRPGEMLGPAPILREVVDAANRGMPVLGVGHGFQVLCEIGLLPGALHRNDRPRFVCRDQVLRVESRDTVWTCALREGQDITIVLATGWGRYVAEPETIARLEVENQVAFRFVGVNPTGSANDIAGITNSVGNVVGLVAHPEHAVDVHTGPSEDGRLIFDGLLAFVEAAT